MTAPRTGFGLIELIVALVLLSVGVLGLVGSAIVAQRSFARAARVEATARAAGAVIDSLLHVPAPAAGSRIETGRAMSWTVTRADGMVRVDVIVHALSGDGVRRTAWHAARAE